MQARGGWLLIIKTYADQQCAALVDGEAHKQMTQVRVVEDFAQEPLVVSSETAPELWLSAFCSAWISFAAWDSPPVCEGIHGWSVR